VQERVVRWLRDLSLIDHFELHPTAPHRRDYEIRIRIVPNAPPVLLTDVGFGISQVLPVLVQCAVVPENTILLIEYPETHLHPMGQSALADVFIETIRDRKVQIVIESHSESLLRRFQRRIAEGHIAHDQIALFFTSMQPDGASQLNPLELDEFGNITNWPDHFFGDEMGDLAAMLDAEMERKN